MPFEKVKITIHILSKKQKVGTAIPTFRVKNPTPIYSYYSNYHIAHQTESKFIKQ